jgi:ATP-binding cassette subfamily B protein
MSAIEKKFNFMDFVRMHIYGLRLAGKLSPGFLPLMIGIALIEALQPLVPLFFTARILNVLLTTKDMNSILWLVSLTLGLSVLLAGVRHLLRWIYDSRSGYSQALQKFNLLLAQRFAKLDYPYVDDGELMEELALIKRLAMGNGLGVMIVFSDLPEFFKSVFSIVTSILMFTSLLSPSGINIIAVFGWWGAVLLFILVGGFGFGAVLLSRFQGLIRQFHAYTAHANVAIPFYNKYVAPAEAAKDIRMYAQQGVVVEGATGGTETQQYIHLQQKGAEAIAVAMGMIAVLSGLVYIVLGYRALGGVITVGDVTQAAGAVVTLINAIASFVAGSTRIYGNTPYLRAIKQFLDLPPVLEKGTRSLPEDDVVITFNNVSFRYPNTTQDVLHNLNLTIHPHERLAVVGLNGSGKTTMIKLLCRLYDPTEGEILLNGVNIKEYDYEAYMELFSVVFQDFELFPFWLGQDVAVSDVVDSDKAMRHLEEAGFGDKLHKMPEGLGTVLYKEFDENGRDLSGGEAQKVALARALYKDAPIVILDEPTAALDPIAEFEVYEGFDQTIGGKTAVFISHRLSSCRFCDRIAVFEAGKMVQYGEHEELLGSEEGLYAALWNAQAKYYQEEAQDEEVS